MAQKQKATGIRFLAFLMFIEKLKFNKTWKIGKAGSIEENMNSIKLLQEGIIFKV